MRVFECIGIEILPLVEYNKYLDTVFKDVEIPIIKNYGDAEKIADYYIKNDNKRDQIKKELKQFVDTNYTPKSS